MLHSLNLPGSDKVAFLNCGECRDTCNDGKGKNGPKHHRHRLFGTVHNGTTECP